MSFLLFLLIFTYFDVNLQNFSSLQIQLVQKNCKGQTTKATTKIFYQKYPKTYSFNTCNLDFCSGGPCHPED